ncbi:MAG: hypothetical protein RIB98_10130 [Acidimicrobiales bacterium]
MSIHTEQIESVVESEQTDSSRVIAAFWWLVVVMAIVGGIAFVMSALGDLRFAHLYRQRTGEGGAFFWFGIRLLVGHCLLAVATFAGLRWRSAVSSTATRRVALGCVVIAIAFLVAVDVVVVWVEAHGDRCVGACG